MLKQKKFAFFVGVIEVLLWSLLVFLKLKYWRMNVQIICLGNGSVVFGFNDILKWYHSLECLSNPKNSNDLANPESSACVENLSTKNQSTWHNGCSDLEQSFRVGDNRPIFLIILRIVTRKWGFMVHLTRLNNMIIHWHWLWRSQKVVNFIYHSKAEWNVYP